MYKKEHGFPRPTYWDLILRHVKTVHVFTYFDIVYTSLDSADTFFPHMTVEWPWDGMRLMLQMSPEMNWQKWAWKVHIWHVKVQNQSIFILHPRRSREKNNNNSVDWSQLFHFFHGYHTSRHCLDILCQDLVCKLKQLLEREITHEWILCLCCCWTVFSNNFTKEWNCKFNCLPPYYLKMSCNFFRFLN